MRYQSFSRRQLGIRFRTWVRRNLKVVAVLAVGAVALIVLEAVLLVGLGSPGPGRWYLLGLLHAVVVAVFYYALSSTFLATDREAIFHVRGAWGEENTRSELKRAKRKKLIWGWVDSVTLESGDIDHLVVTKSGGIVAIDSKWRNQAPAIAQESMAREARKAALRANGVVQTLLKSERGGHRAKHNPTSVTPLVVLWGSVQGDVPAGARIDGIDFIAGRDLVRWLDARDGDAVDKSSAADALRRIEAFRTSAWSRASNS